MNEEPGMWFLLGFFTAWFLFAKPTVQNAGFVLLNSNEEVLLVRNPLFTLWGFPTYHGVPQNVSYLQSALTKLSEETSLQAEKDIELLSGGCQYQTTLYYFGVLKSPDLILPGSDTLSWFSIHSLPSKRSWLMQSWIEDGMPMSCGNDEL